MQCCNLVCDVCTFQHHLESVQQCYSVLSTSFVARCSLAQIHSGRDERVAFDKLYSDVKWWLWDKIFKCKRKNLLSMFFPLFLKKKKFTKFTYAFQVWRLQGGHDLCSKLGQRPQRTELHWNLRSVPAGTLWPLTLVIYFSYAFLLNHLIYD